MEDFISKIKNELEKTNRKAEALKLLLHEYTLDSKPHQEIVFSLPELVLKVNKFFNTDITTRSRNVPVLYPRIMYFKYARENSAASLIDIGKAVKCHHATVLNAIDRFDRLHKTDDFSSAYRNLTQHLSKA